MARFERELLAVLPRLRRFARSLADDAAGGDELCAAALEQAIKARDQWQPDTRLDSSMYRFICNLWADRSDARMPPAAATVLLNPGAKVGDRPAALTGAGVAPVEVSAAMARLPDEQREAVALVLVEGLAYREAAAVLEVPVATLTSWLLRGRQAMMRDLGATV